MALTADASKGFEHIGYIERNESMWVPGDPGDTYDVGDIVTVPVGAGVGVLDKVDAANEVGYGVVRTTVVCSALGLPFPKFGANPQSSLGGTVDAGTKESTLVEIIPLIPAGTPKFQVTFANQFDETVVSYLATTPYIELTTGMATDEYPDGAIVYCYDGTGAGEFSTVASYDHTGGAVSLELTLHRKFASTLDTTSKLIVLSGEAATYKGVGFMSRCDTDSGAGKINVNGGADLGEWMNILSAQTLAGYMQKLMMPVVKANSLALA